MAKFVVTPPSSTEIVINIPGPQGPQGNAGTGIVIKGTFATADSLPNPPANNSDAYMVGTDLYIWTGTAWYNAGPFQGPKGNTGDQGTQGVPGERGIQGERGYTGLQGAPGTPGAQGIQGVPGERGETGDPGTLSQSASGAPYIASQGLIYIGVDFPTNFPDGSIFFKRV